MRTAVTADAIPVVHAGERWQLDGAAEASARHVNPGGFDLEAWLLEHDLRATGYVRRRARNVRLDAFAGRPGRLRPARARGGARAHPRRAARTRRTPACSSRWRSATSARSPRRNGTVFNRTGVSHLICISGLHVTVFAALAGGAAFALARRSAAAHDAHARAQARGRRSACSPPSATCCSPARKCRRCARSLMLAVAALRLVARRGPGTARVVLAVGAGDRAAVGSLGRPRAGVLAVVRRGGPAAVRGHRTPAPRRARRRWRARLARCAARGRACAVGGDDRPRAGDARAVPAGVARIAPLANAVAIPVVTLGVVPLALAGIVVPFDVAVAGRARGVRVADALPRSAGGVAGRDVGSSMRRRRGRWSSRWPASLWLLAPRGVPGRGLGVALAACRCSCVPPAAAAGRRVAADRARRRAGAGRRRSRRTRTRWSTTPARASPRRADAGGRIVAPYLRAPACASLDALVVSHQDLDHSGGALSLLRDGRRSTRLVSSLPADHPIVARAAAPNCVALRRAGQALDVGRRALFEFCIR